MKLRTLRNALMLGVAAISASFEAPRLANHSLSEATQSLVDLPQEIGDVVEEVASNVTGSPLGFDTNLYPGDKAMNAWKQSGEYEWVGYYLPAPCHKDDSWSGTRARLVDAGWGLAVIYVGQQTWSKSFGAATTVVKSSAKATKRPNSASKKSKKS